MQWNKIMPINYICTFVCTWNVMKKKKFLIKIRIKNEKIKIIEIWKKIIGYFFKIFGKLQKRNFIFFAFIWIQIL